MSTPCIVSGLLVDSTGAVRANTKMVFRPARVRSQYGNLVAPFDVEAMSDAAGLLTVAILPGPYTGLLAVQGNTRSFAVSVPEKSTADLAECISGPDTEITPQALVDTRAARDAAQAFYEATVALGNVNFDGGTATSIPIPSPAIDGGTATT